MFKNKQRTYIIKGLKTFHGMEGGGYSCNVYKTTHSDGRAKKIGVAENHGTGGPDSFAVTVKDEHAYDGPTYKAFKAWCEAFMIKKWKEDGEENHGFEYVGAIEWFMSFVIEEAELLKQYKRWCKTQTVFRLKGDPEGQFRTINMRWGTFDVVDHMDKKYGDEIETIVNRDLI